VQAVAPARLIEGGMPTDATIAQVLVSKYADHLPLYRQAQIYAGVAEHTGPFSEREIGGDDDGGARRAC
jgi:transposase